MCVDIVLKRIYSLIGSEHSEQVIVMIFKLNSSKERTLNDPSYYP